jgi:hypothetical protein
LADFADLVFSTFNQSWDLLATVYALMLPISLINVYRVSENDLFQWALIASTLASVSVRIGVLLA